MSSLFAWLDHDDQARRRMLEVVDLFSEKGTLDELGIGTIRDTFSDYFFPGTSTIQTRVRYFLFLPWIYLELERERVPSEQVAHHARIHQQRLVESLLRGETKGHSGIIGRQAGESLKRQPASIYWNGLGRWGIRRFPGTIAQYHASLNNYYRALASASAADSGELLDARPRNWEANIPPAPGSFLEKTDFRLTREEAQFLADQILQHCDGSLLGALLKMPKTDVRAARQCWDLAERSTLHSALRDRVEDGRRFALLMEGAVLLYNLMLAEKLSERDPMQSTELTDRYRAQLDRWADGIVAGLDDFRAWDLDAFRSSVWQLNRRVPLPALEFCRLWMSAAIASPRGVIENQQIRAAIAHRERRLKGALARLWSERALENWSSASGLGLLDYRWGISRQIALDIFDGLSRPPGTP